MKKIIITLLLASEFFISGCTTYWYQEGRSFNKCKQDRNECVAELQKYHDLSDIGDPEVKFMENCMIGKGYILLSESKLPPKTKRQDPTTSLYWRLHGISGALE